MLLQEFHASRTIIPTFDSSPLDGIQGIRQRVVQIESLSKIPLPVVPLLGQDAMHGIRWMVVVVVVVLRLLLTLMLVKGGIELGQADSPHALGFILGRIKIFVRILERPAALDFCAPLHFLVVVVDTTV